MSKGKGCGKERGQGGGDEAASLLSRHRNEPVRRAGPPARRASSCSRFAVGRYGARCENRRDGAAAIRRQTGSHGSMRRKPGRSGKIGTVWNSRSLNRALSRPFSYRDDEIFRETPVQRIVLPNDRIERHYQTVSFLPQRPVFRLI